MTAVSLIGCCDDTITDAFYASYLLIVFHRDRDLPPRLADL